MLNKNLEIWIIAIEKTFKILIQLVKIGVLLVEGEKEDEFAGRERRGKVMSVGLRVGALTGEVREL